MPLDPTILSASLVARFFTLWRSPPPPDKAQDKDYYLTLFSTIIAEEVINHFKAFAKCQGSDSHGDSHDNVGIV